MPTNKNSESQQSTTPFNIPFLTLGAEGGSVNILKTDQCFCFKENSGTLDELNEDDSLEMQNYRSHISKPKMLKTITELCAALDDKYSYWLRLAPYLEKGFEFSDELNIELSKRLEKWEVNVVTNWERALGEKGYALKV